MTTPADWKRLVVTRRLREGVVVDGPARFVVTAILDGHMEITVYAPETTRILRDELTEYQSNAG